ncbi:MAG: PAS domain-containing protein [Burkholderiales bacterium]|nr:PAS domain-containing protein [Burkholderiales bacterium]
MTEKDKRTEEREASPPGDDASSASSWQALRQRAEARFLKKAARSPENIEALSREETRQMLHELRVHQIELEMQNEELRESQAALDAVRARYFDLYDLAPVGYCTVSEPGLIMQANLTAASLLGVARSALVKRPLSRFIHK